MSSIHEIHSNNLRTALLEIAKDTEDVASETKGKIKEELERVPEGVIHPRYLLFSDGLIYLFKEQRFVVPDSFSLEKLRQGIIPSFKASEEASAKGFTEHSEELIERTKEMVGKVVSGKEVREEIFGQERPIHRGIPIAA